MNAHDVLELAWLIPALPLLGSTILFLGRRHLREPTSGWLATVMMAAAFGMSVWVFTALASLPGEERVVQRELFDWISAGGFSVKALLLVDPLSVTMALFVTGVGALIHLYSIGYMHGQERFTRFFTYLNLFAFSMLVLVLAGDYLLVFLGWEGVGLCSYLLISFWFERPSAAVAGKKAFVTNRVGDFGFMLAMFLIFAHLGTLQLVPALEGVEKLTSGTATAIALFLYLGAAGRAPRDRSSSGCPTPWRVRPRCPPSSTPPPWSPPACTSCPARTPSSSTARWRATWWPGWVPSPPWWRPPSP